MDTRGRARLLAAAALGIVAVCCLCCKPAWSPDGSKVAFICTFPYENEEFGYLSAAIYDLKSQQTEIVAKERTKSPPDVKPTDAEAFAPLAVFWPARGEGLFYVSASTGDLDNPDKVRVSVYGPVTKKTRIVCEVPAPPGKASNDNLPSYFLQGSRWLWQMTDEGCYRTDLKNGKTKQLKKEKCVVFGAGKKLFSVRVDSDENVTFGKVRTFPSLRAATLFTLRHDTDESLVPVLAAPRDVTRFGCLRIRDKASQLDVLDRKGHLVRRIALPERFQTQDSGSGADWNCDGKRLWLPVGETAILEVNIDDGTLKPIEIGATPLVLSLSPDGKHLAALVQDKIEERTCESGKEETTTRKVAGLCIVDLASDERPAHLIIPAKAAAAPPAEESR